MIPIRDKKTDISPEIAAGRKLHEKIKFLANEVANKSIETGEDLDSVIAEVAKREGFNQIQIQRLVEEGNTVTYNKRYDKLRSNNDRRIDFPIASLEGVLKDMGSDAPPEEVNPNMAKGSSGSGNMDKAASTTIESAHIHNPNSRLDERKEKYDKKLNALKERRTEQDKKASEREYSSTIFKIANSLVMTERMYKTANEVFNTMLSDVSIPEEIVDGIVKKAAEISEVMVKSRKAQPGFVVTLSENPAEKVANHLLGEYSLLKEAETNSPKVKNVKVQPTMDVASYSQLVNLAGKLQK